MSATQLSWNRGSYSLHGYPVPTLASDSIQSLRRSTNRTQDSNRLNRIQLLDWVRLSSDRNVIELTNLVSRKKPLRKRYRTHKPQRSIEQNGTFTFRTPDNNNGLYLHDHRSTYIIAKAIFRNQNYNTGQLRYFDNNLSRTSKQAEMSSSVHWSNRL